MPTSLEEIIKTPDRTIKLGIVSLGYAFVIGSSLAAAAFTLNRVTEKQEEFAARQVILQGQAVELARQDAIIEAEVKKNHAVANEVHANINRTLDAIMKMLE